MIVAPYGFGVLVYSQNGACFGQCHAAGQGPQYGNSQCSYLNRPNHKPGHIFGSFHTYRDPNMYPENAIILYYGDHHHGTPNFGKLPNWVSDPAASQTFHHRGNLLVGMQPIDNSGRPMRTTRAFLSLYPAATNHGIMGMEWDSDLM